MLKQLRPDVNGIPYPVIRAETHVYHSTEVYTAKVFNLAQLKISKAGGSRVNEFDIHHAVSHEIPTHVDVA